MSKQIPPLPDLEILESTRQELDQATVDRAIRIIYERRPDLFIKIAAREKDDSDIEEVAKDFFQFLYEVVKKEIDISDEVPILRETRRRVRLMYGFPL